MGFRFRKSINVGAGFRVNLSKSGVGYSWGGKGFRMTKTATGRTRTTASIPGTGLSWVEESGSKKQKNGSRVNTQPTPQIQNDSVHLYSIENADVGELVPAQLQDFLSAIKRYRTVNTLFLWLSVCLFVLWAVSLSNNPDGVGTIVLFAIFLISLPVKFAYKLMGRVNVQYDCDEYGEKRIELISQLVTILKNNKMLWQVNDVFSNTQKRTNAGAGTSVAKFAISIKNKKPPFLKTNAKCYFIQLKKEKLYIMPDKILVINRGKTGVIDLADLDMVVGDTNFVENIAPKDATIVRHTWQFVNNNGTPDKRFKNNRQLPVCRYGTISFKTKEGFNTMIYCSNFSLATEFLQVMSTHLQQKL